jgi:PD-(D/E)XK nuclease superfamily
MLNKYSDLTPEQEEIVSATIGCAIAVHRELGPGFKESIYQNAYRLELDSQAISFESEKIVVRYRQMDHSRAKNRSDSGRNCVGRTESRSAPASAAQVSSAVVPSHD